MKKVFLVILLIIIHFQLTIAQSKPCSQASELITMFNKYHVKPISLNDTVTDQIFKSFYKSLDVENVFFTAEDIKVFDDFKPIIIENKYGNSVCDFLAKVTDIYIKRLKSAEEVATTLLQQPFNYSTTDSMQFSRMYIQRFADTEEIRNNRWNRKLKYTLIETMVNLNDSIDFEHIDSTAFSKIESDLRAKLLKREKRLIQHITEYPSGTESLLAEMFLNSIANRFDPHSFYFTQSGKEDFLAAISTEVKSFGISISETPKGEIAIEKITPGSAAFKSGLLHQGDVIMQLIKPDGNSMDLTFASKEEATALLNTATYDHFTFNIRTLNGSKLSVPLQKEKLKVEANNTNGYILEGNRRIAYICLPDFYTNGNERQPRGVSIDVAKEISILKRKKIDGLIIDLRFNGGGSLEESIAFISLFIDKGPLLMVKFLKERPSVIKDSKPGTIYDGPIVILVNGLSASASEVAASTMQDYNRAVIVGSRTFGKATAQYTLPLDSTLNIYMPSAVYKQDAFINITMERLYKVNGKSLQKIGLEPDIELPDILKTMNINESAEPYALNNDRVFKKTDFNQLPELPIQKLKTESEQRILASEVLNRVKHITDSIVNITDSTITIPLTFAAYKQKHMKETDMLVKIQKLSENSSNSLPYHISGKYSSKRITKHNFYNKTIEETLIQQVKEDVYIREAYLILNDLINISTKHSVK